MAERGFSLLELVTTIAIIAILAGIVTPLVGNMIEEARVNRATSEVKVLAEAIVNLYKDTAQWPLDTLINTTTGTTNSWNSDRNRLLSRGTIAAKIWKGPYVSKQIGLDPWNTSYIYRTNNVTYVKGVLSCGPNKTENGSLLVSNNRAVQQDDIVYYIQ